MGLGVGVARCSCSVLLDNASKSRARGWLESLTACAQWCTCIPSGARAVLVRGARVIRGLELLSESQSVRQWYFTLLREMYIFPGLRPHR